MVALLSVLIGLAAIQNIRADARGQLRQVFVWKPLTTVLILILALALPSAVSDVYRLAVALGLLFSLAGDVFLMLPRDHFLAGLVSFFTAHLCYGTAFATENPALSPVAALMLAIVGVLLLRQLWPHVGRLRVPVVLYALVLLAMAWLALGQWNAKGGLRTTFAALGASLFVVSDAVLALERFVARHRHGQTVVLGTYFAAQWLIALSVSATW